MLEEDVVDVVDETDIKVVAEIQHDETEEVELIEEPVISVPEPAMPPAPALPDPPAQGLIPADASAPPPINRPVICHSCSSRFEIASGNTSANCPVCDERIVL